MLTINTFQSRLPIPQVPACPRCMSLLVTTPVPATVQYKPQVLVACQHRTTPPVTTPVPAKVQYKPQVLAACQHRTTPPVTTPVPATVRYKPQMSACQHCTSWPCSDNTCACISAVRYKPQMSACQHCTSWPVTTPTCEISWGNDTDDAKKNNNIFILFKMLSQFSRSIALHTGSRLSLLRMPINYDIQFSLCQDQMRK